MTKCDRLKQLEYENSAMREEIEDDARRMREALKTHFERKAIFDSLVNDANEYLKATENEELCFETKSRLPERTWAKLNGIKK